jgi:hypothetical protein
MGIKLTYICDNCKAESSVPEKWFRLAPFETERDSGVAILPFRTEEAKRTKSFCGESCALYYISTQLSKLHKEENPKPSTGYTKNLKEFINADYLNSLSAETQRQTRDGSKL